MFCLSFVRMLYLASLNFFKKGVFFQVLTRQVMSWFYESCVWIPDTKNEA